MHLCLGLGSGSLVLGSPSIRVAARMEPPLEGPPVSSPDPVTTDSVEQLASISNHALSDMPVGSPSVLTHTRQPYVTAHAGRQLGLRAGQDGPSLFLTTKRLGRESCNRRRELPPPGL